MTYAREPLCRTCHNQGLVRIRYQSQEPDDIAICDCRRGFWFRAGGVGLVRMHLRVPATARIAYLEDFAEPAVMIAAREAQTLDRLTRNEW